MPSSFSRLPSTCILRPGPLRILKYRSVCGNFLSNNFIRGELSVLCLDLAETFDRLLTKVVVKSLPNLSQISPETAEMQEAAFKINIWMPNLKIPPLDLILNFHNEMRIQIQT